MATPCRAINCSALVTSRLQRGYCDKHADRRYNWQKRHGRSENTTARGYGHDWRKVREQVLQRDDYLCVMCKANDRIVQATDVDHVKAKKHGGTDDLDNLQSLCRVCHKHKTATVDSRGG